MRCSSVALPLILFLSSFPLAFAEYRLHEVYHGRNFFNKFNFFSASDPTHGFVNYMPKHKAKRMGLIGVKHGVAHMGVDHKHKYRTHAEGRPSVRIESKKSYTHGLFIADIKHMPASACGIWPAFWTLGEGSWPQNGEIDIIEGVSKNTLNQMTLHTADSCQVGGAPQTGNLLNGECSVPTSTGGCGVQGSGGGYGDDFNRNGGGVYAMEWTGKHIKMWFFPRGRVPASIRRGHPKVHDFGTPTANFQGTCNIKGCFKSHRLIFNTSFCGDWAGNAYDTATCPSVPGLSPYASCIHHVARHPQAFKNAYWAVNSVKIYKQH